MSILTSATDLDRLYNVLLIAATYPDRSQRERPILLESEWLWNQPHGVLADSVQPRESRRQEDPLRVPASFRDGKIQEVG